ncbi:MAG TPA: ATP-binding protein [Mucilaginibacter sp.]|nr:ATP-binding protein [Mucilaginibacter sp.]
MHEESITVSPTKRLFISILTQDITLEAGILDLIDNSVDSYTRKRYAERRKIDLIINHKEFSIFDTCGGIQLDILKEQVFRFGSKVDSLDNPTLGMYGIGLKRSIFKMGDNVKLETHDGEDYSLMNLDVPQWQQNDNVWDIPFETEKSNLQPNQKPFTKITISRLHKEIAAQLGSAVFINDLIEKIKKTYCLIIKDHIDVSLNGSLIEPYDLYVPEDENYKPSVIIDHYNGIDIRIICFIDPSQGTRLKHAINAKGWNVFCNKRLILSNDVTELTGWKGGSAEDKSTLPKSHQLFNEFRGMVFLEANNPFNLPLNTSKTQLNTENPSYHYILRLMIKAARPIIDYIYLKKNKQKQEIEAIEEEVNTPTDNDNYNPQNQAYTTFNTNTVFAAPKPNIIISTTVRIGYSVEKEIFEKVRRNLAVKTNKEVGLKTFEYYISMEL